MAVWEWTRDMMVGIDDIDFQHQELIDIISMLHETTEGLQFDSAHRTLIYLESYVVVHFGTEELYMKQFEYPNTEAHVTEHRKFKEDFDNIRLDFARRGASPMFVEHIKSWSAHWLFDHVAKHDVEMGSYIKAKMDEVGRRGRDNR
jgi:hemerythrin